jgi:hypothetical protein
MGVADGDPVPWTKPEDIEFDLKKDLPDLRKAFGGRINVCMGHGSERMIDLTKPRAETVKALITRVAGRSSRHLMTGSG